MTIAPQARLSNWFFLFIILLALGKLLRLLDITNPPLDFQPSRQLRNSLVARDIYYSLLPTATTEQRDLASSFARSVGQYEPPVTESIVAVTYLFTGGENFISARVWSTLFWLLAGIALFDLARRAVSPWGALLGLAYYLVLPFSVQASRSFQPDPLMTSAFVIGIYFLYRWSESSGVQELATASDSERSDSRKESWKWAILAGVFLGLATFVKIVIAFFVGGAAIALVLFTLKKKFWKSKQVWAMAVLMIVPALIFYILLNQGRSTEYFFAWTATLIKLITSTDFYSKWLAFIGSLFGLTIIFLSLVGALLAPPRLRWLLISLWVGYLLYGLTLPFQMYTHSYYHIQLIPIIALGLAAALNPLIESVATQSRVGRAGLIALTVAVIGYQSWMARSVLVAEDFRHEPVFWKQVGDVIPADVDVIALTQDYGFRLMQWGWRKVSLWPLSTDLSEARGGNQGDADFASLTKGKEYFLVTAFGQLDKQPDLKEILAQYPIAAQGDGYVLYDLRELTLVSIITPSFNQAAYLEQTMQSVLGQDYSHIEYIVVDGASTDNSVDIIRKYESKLTWWVSEKDKGQADAINKGFARATGEVIAWLNSDDYYLAGTIGAAVKIFDEHPDVVLVYGDMLAVDEEGKTFNTLNYKQLTLEDLLCFQIIGQPAVFIRRSALQAAGRLDPTFHFMLDHHLWIRIAQQGKIFHANQTWAAARYHAEAKNIAKAAEFGRDAFRILDWAKAQPELAPTLARISHRADASAYRVDARYLLDGGKPASALSAWVRALFIHPPTALARLNIFVSAILNLFGLGKLRSAILRNRKARHQ